MFFGFIGTGNIATAIIRGMKTNFSSASDIFVFDTNESKKHQICEEFGVKCCKSSIELLEKCDIVFLAVKPNVLQNVLAEIKDSLKISKNLLVSIAAGKTIEFITEKLGFENPIIRVMPNVNAAVGESMTGICCNAHVAEQARKTVFDIFNSMGQAAEISENMFPVFTVLCGSAPAFTFLFIESLAKAAHKSGMDKNLAVRLAAQTVLGSAKTLSQTKKHPCELIDSVCSPGGMTIEGIASLSENGFESAVINAFDAALNKDKKL